MGTVQGLRGIVGLYGDYTGIVQGLGFSSFESSVY